MEPQVSSAYPALPAPKGIHLATLPAHECSYLPDRICRSRAFVAERLDPLVYHELMNAGFRRSGRLIYQPVCAHCRACTPIRVPSDRFAPSKSQRRCWKKNRDLHVTISSPLPDEEKFQLYRRYTLLRHHQEEPDGAESFLTFLYDSPVDTLEFVYRDSSGRLLAVGICDACLKSLSSVYFYFDPEEHRRGLGTFGVLFELAYARRRKIPYYYLGYWIDRCATMRYKAQFRPNQLLGSDGVWRENSIETILNGS